MPSKRGRKRNDNLPPNRARDIQRAFRARRAAHLQALEQRVTELEEENNKLRQALDLPPSNRSPLGKGPTGKDKSKASVASISSDQYPALTPTGRESPIAESPSSRTCSLSPHTINVSMSPPPMQVTEGGPLSHWSSPLPTSDRHRTNTPGPSTASPYQLTFMTGSPPHRQPYSNSLSSSRNSVSHDISDNPHSPDRPSQSYSGQSFILQDTEVREEHAQRYPYVSSSLQTLDHTAMDSQSPSPGMQPQAHRQQPREPPLSYHPLPHLRHLADPQGLTLGKGFPYLPQTQAQVPTNVHYIKREGVHDQDEAAGGFSPPPLLSRRYYYDPEGPLNHSHP